MAPVIAAAIIGAGASLAGSGIQAYSNYKAQEAELDAKKDAAKQLRNQGVITDNEYNEILNQIETYYKERGSIGNQNDADEYRKAIYGLKDRELENNGKAYSANDFNFKGTKED